MPHNSNLHKIVRPKLSDKSVVLKEINNYVEQTYHKLNLLSDYQDFNETFAKRKKNLILAGVDRVLNSEKIRKGQIGETELHSQLLDSYVQHQARLIRFNVCISFIPNWESFETHRTTRFERLVFLSTAKFINALKKEIKTYLADIPAKNASRNYYFPNSDDYSVLFTDTSNTIVDPPDHIFRGINDPRFYPADMPKSCIGILEAKVPNIPGLNPEYFQYDKPSIWLTEFAAEQHKSLRCYFDEDATEILEDLWGDYEGCRRYTVPCSFINPDNDEEYLVRGRTL